MLRCHVTFLDTEPYHRRGGGGTLALEPYHRRGGAGGARALEPYHHRGGGSHSPWNPGSYMVQFWMAPLPRPEYGYSLYSLVRFSSLGIPPPTSMSIGAEIQILVPRPSPPCGPMDGGLVVLWIVAPLPPPIIL